MELTRHRAGNSLGLGLAVVVDDEVSGLEGDHAVEFQVAGEGVGLREVPVIDDRTGAVRHALSEIGKEPL